MANEEHLKILRKGVEVWNKWREANPEVEPDLFNVNLECANLYEAKFSRARLGNTNFSNANLIGANLSVANLTKANFSNADLKEATLDSSQLRHANLTNANLSRVQAVYTNFQGATLTGACIEDWHINACTNLKDVICDYVYREWDRLKNVGAERRPHTGTFAPGEFAKLVQQSFDTIDLIFHEGLGWKAFAYSFKQVEVLHEDAHLEVRSIENKGDGVVIVKVAAAPDTDKALIHSDFMKGYEFASKAIATQYEARLLEKGTEINRLFHLLQVMAEKAGNTNYYGDIKATNFTPHGTAMGGVFNDFSNTQDLTQVASQIQALLAQVQQQGHSPEDAQQQVANDLAEQAMQDPTTLGKLMMWGQKLGDATITDVVKGVVKLALRSAGVPLP